MKNLHKPLIYTCIAMMIYSIVACAQALPMLSLKLDDMSSFNEQRGNWTIVGNVLMDPTVDVGHKTGPAENPITDGKHQAVTFEPGVGVLLNINSAEKKSHLVTKWKHGDIDISVEVMLPKGSNSGIYLQGRYEVQLFDSWGKENAIFLDMGGIYENFEKDPEKKFIGQAPLINASKAAGVWQTLKISFQAPRFDSNGKKISNAIFKSVELNGKKIQDQVELPWTTGAPIENNEKAKGPLMIQGDHGPVAFRNFRYRMLPDPK